MALKLATAQKPPKKRGMTPPPKQEHSSKKEDLLDSDKEYKYDHATGGLVEVDPGRKRNKYPSCDITSKVARCVYCEKVRDKSHMRCLGQNYHEAGSLRYVWACKGCYAGSPSWLKHYKHKSPMGSLWNYDLDKDKRIRRSDEEEKGIGRRVVEKVLGQVDAGIMKALSKKRKSHVQQPERRGVVVKREEERGGGKEMRSSKVPRWQRKGRSATIRRGRG